MPWAFDAGDGPRLPTRLYAALAVLASLVLNRRPARRDGDCLLWFMGASLAFRFVFVLWKAHFGPDPRLSGPDRLLGIVTPIRAVALLGACYAATRLRSRPA